MNLADVAILAALASAALGGYRLGFVARVFSWVGMWIAIVLAVALLPAVVRQFDQMDSTGKLLVGTGFLLGLALLGQAGGTAIGVLAHARFPLSTALRRVDQFTGALTGLLGVLVAVWLMTPAFAAVPGWPARLIRESSVAAGLSWLAPPPPDTARTLRSLVRESGFPEVLGGLEAAPDVGAPPATGIDQAVLDRVSRSTVKVTGQACDRIQQGSGFVVGDHLVVTNAHVVAGDRSVAVTPFGGQPLGATVVAFDPDRDLAVLRVEGLRRISLPIGRAEVGATGVVLGHPEGRPLRAAAARVESRIDAVGRDIYDRRKTEREVLVLAAVLRPGDSGAALVDHDGYVVGVAFAVAPDQAGVAYALTDTALAQVLKATGTAEVSTGRCAG